jgi:hypothetical protein
MKRTLLIIASDMALVPEAHAQAGYGDRVAKNDKLRGKTDFAKSASDTRDFSVTFDALLKN